MTGTYQPPPATDTTIDDRYEVLLASASCAVARLDLELRICDFNPQAEQMFDLVRADVIGHDFAELAHLAHDGAALVADLEHARAGHSLCWTECAFRGSYGQEMVLLWTASPVRSAAGIVGLVLVCQDLTERRHAERRARAAERDADRQRRLAEVGAVVARLTHDLNNPLTAARLNLAIIRDAAARHPATEVGRFHVEVADIDASLEQVGRLIEGCRHFLRDQRLELAPLPVAALLRGVLRTWSPSAAQRGIQLRAQAAPDLPQVLADAGKLTRVLDNLVGNALEAIGQGPGAVTLLVERCTSGLAITVEDTGPGLPEGVDVFTAFATTKPQGLGLGLAIARELVVAHGGTIEVNAVAPHGARFRITVPERPPQPETPATDASPAETMQAS